MSPGTLSMQGRAQGISWQPQALGQSRAGGETSLLAPSCQSAAPLPAGFQAGTTSLPFCTPKLRHLPITRPLGPPGPSRGRTQEPQSQTLAHPLWKEPAHGLGAPHSPISARSCSDTFTRSGWGGKAEEKRGSALVHLPRAANGAGRSWGPGAYARATLQPAWRGCPTLPHRRPAA